MKIMDSAAAVSSKIHIQQCHSVTQHIFVGRTIRPPGMKDTMIDRCVIPRYGGHPYHVLRAARVVSIIPYEGWSGGGWVEFPNTLLGKGVHKIVPDFFRQNVRF